jgi:hypothetical protein
MADEITVVTEIVKKNGEEYVVATYSDGLVVEAQL